MRKILLPRSLAPRRADLALVAVVALSVIGTRPAPAEPDRPPTPPPPAAQEAPREEPTYSRPTPKRPASRVALDQISDWNVFYREFRAAIARRDREALKECMVKNFLFTLAPVHEMDRRDAAFREWDRPEVRGWEQIERVLARGTRWDPMVPTLKVAPPEWITNPRYVDYRLGFERRDGVWRWVWTMRGQ